MIDTCTGHVLCTLKCFKKDLTHKNGGLWWALDDVQTMSSLPANIFLLQSKCFSASSPKDSRLVNGRISDSGRFFAYPLVICYKTMENHHFSLIVDFSMKNGDFP